MEIEPFVGISTVHIIKYIYFVFILADTLEWILKSISTFSKCPCSSHTCKSKSFGYVVGIALMSKLEIPNG